MNPSKMLLRLAKRIHTTMSLTKNGVPFVAHGQYRVVYMWRGTGRALAVRWTPRITMTEHLIANVQGMICGSAFIALLVAASPKKFRCAFLDAMHWAVGVWDAQMREIVDYFRSW